MNQEKEDIFSYNIFFFQTDNYLFSDKRTFRAIIKKRRKNSKQI